MSKHDINCEWLDVGEYLKENKVTDPQVISKLEMRRNYIQRNITCVLCVTG